MGLSLALARRSGRFQRRANHPHFMQDAAGRDKPGSAAGTLESQGLWSFRGNAKASNP
jgi:hypothetical protein